VNSFLAVISFVFFAFLILVFPAVAAPYLVRKLGDSPMAPGPVSRVMRCPRCESTKLACLPSNGITPFPGYQCRACSLELRPRKTTFFYSIVLLLSVGLILLFSMGLWADVDGPIYLYPFMFVTAIYSVMQLLRPTPRLTTTWTGTRGIRVPEGQR